MWSLTSSTLIASGCLFTYVVFLAFVSFPADWVTSTTFGVNIQKLPENESNFWNICHLPKYDIWDEEIIQYFDPDTNPLKKCDSKFHRMTELRDSQWSIIETEENFKNNKTTNCRARCHTRKSERENFIGNWSYVPGPVNCEVLETVCSNKRGIDFYGWLHSQIVETPLEPPKYSTTGMKQYDVVVILIDSLSHTQAVRSLPRTLSYFKNHMEGVVFPYMNKVGENSRPNGVALWFGKSMEKVDRSLFEEPTIDRDWKHSYFCKTFKDNETFLFKEFHDYGYKTMLGEDWSEGTMNWPNCVGFEKQPTDHYMRPFQNAYERKGTDVTKKHLSNKSCREYHHTLLDYLEQFNNAYTSDVKKFSWIWVTVLGHSNENGVVHADKDFHTYLMKNRQKLDNSFVFILGDHGLRFGKVTETKLGSLERNNPITAISIPKELRGSTDLLQIMRENAKKLQTHYDTRATMLDILKYQSKAHFMDTEPIEILNEKGHSLIRRQPNNPRSCRTLPIPLEYCICQFNKTEEDRNSTISEIIGRKVIEAVNLELKDGGFDDDCIEMVYAETLSLKRFEHTFHGAHLYTILVKATEPSLAIFKVDVKVNANNMSEVKVLGTIERSSLYGKTANCIKAEFYRPYCYCRKQ
ncbi:unnamed protein product [Caenorhabditis angaria]|uniref:Uncharacterized protein n=1 Tax=Caenorhabditis angaria TaxID=860376 RepID=A0A9P1N942_9PELO|nr:unnamed protein product [Caenorhabditis angaria]